MFEQSIEFYIGLLFIVFPFLVLGWVFYFYEVTIKKWKTTEGVILRNIVKIDKTDRNLESKSNSWRNYIIYEYGVGGKFYQNNDRHTQNLIWKSSFKSHVDIDDRFTEGQKVKVYYNPEKPHKSVIDNAFDSNNLAILFVSLIGIVLAFYAWK